MLRFAPFLALVVFVSVLLRASPAGAHAAPHSTVLLDFGARDVACELHLPVRELEAALHRSLVPEQDQIVVREAEALRAHVAQYLHAESPSGASWSVNVGTLTYQVDDEVPFVVVHTVLTPPAGESPQVFVLDYDVIAHEVVNHTAWVAVRSDFANGVVGGQPTVIGVIRYLRKSLRVDRTGGGAMRGFAGMFRLGMQHIAEGTDHLLFLLALLLPAPLLAKRVGGTRRWGAYAGLRTSGANLLRVVTAFTLGHSLTLFAGAVGWFRAPGQMVEVLIAVSILVSSIHALRPLFPGKEGWVAAGFGLVHGMAFAGALSEMHLDPYRLALAIFGFNLGIEVMQLIVVAASFPWLVMLARTPAYAAVRWMGGLFAGAAALGWVAERTVRWGNPMNAVVEAMATRPLLILLALAGSALVATVASARSGDLPKPAWRRAARVR